jgi:DNA-binding response OmpR family regulator
MFDYALRMAGFSVTSVDDGLTALRSIEQQLPDVIVLDLDLPRVSGVDVHQEIVSHAETSAIPIIVVTGTTWRSPEGVFRTLRKPVGAEIVARVIRQALANQVELSGDDARRLD